MIFKEIPLVDRHFKLKKTLINGQKQRYIKSTLYFC